MTGLSGPIPMINGVRRGVLTSGAADQLAALVARAAGASSGLIHFVEGQRLRLYGGWGLLIPWEDVADTPVRDSLAGVVVAAGEPVVIEDLGTDPRVPAGSPIRQRGMTGAYLGHPVRAENGDIVGICCALDHVPRAWTPDQIAAVDEAAQVGRLLITEQLARHEVDRQRRFLDAVLDNLHDGVTACDADGNIVLVNSRMRRLWGSATGHGDDGEEATGHRDDGKEATGHRDDGNEATGHRDDGKEATRPRDPGDELTVEGLYDATGNPVKREDVALLRALRGEQLRDEELVLKGRARRTRYFMIDAQPIIGPDGRSLGAVQAVQDVTRRKRAERFRICELAVTTALAEAPSVEAAGPRVLEALVSTLDWAHAELWLVDDAGGVLRPAAQWSAPGWDAELRVPVDLGYGQGLAGRAWQAGKPLWIRDVGQPQSLITRETAVSSRLHTALALPVRDGIEPLGVLTAFTDAVEDPEDEIVALVSGIAAHIGQFVERKLVEDLQRQLSRSKNEFLALVGHELRTPLTSISAYTEILRDIDPATLATEGPLLLEVIERNTSQLRSIINELLELSALDTGQTAVQLFPVDLAEVVREAVDCTRQAVDGGALTIEADLPGELVLPGDRKRLRQVVDNLLGNAVKYSPDGGRISVLLRVAGRAAELCVSDTGIGVSGDEREKMFAGLYRTSRAYDRAIPGTGLGLTFSRAVVHRHHGTIELAEHEGPGTTVRVRLPLEPR